MPGDSISDVTFKLATELCDLLNQLDISTFDLSCFNPICPTPENIHDLIQFLIDKICALQEGIADVGGQVNRVAGSGGCTGCVVTTAQCFWYVDPLGNQITQMEVSDYAKVIGNKVCTLVTQINNIQTSINQQQTQINWIIENYAPKPQITLPTFGSVCLTDKIPSVPPGGVNISAMINAIQDALCELRAATGMPTEILNSIFQQCINMDSLPSMNLPGVNMGSLPGWIGSGSYSTLADSINNMWITVCDMRAAITSIQTNCCPSGCDGLEMQMQTTFTAPSTLTLFFTGNGTGFQDCAPAGSMVTIKDAFGATYITQVPVIPNINNMAGYVLDLSASPLNLASNLTVRLEFCAKRIDSGAICERCIDTSVVNTAACPPVALSATQTTLTYSITNSLAGNSEYQVDLRVNGNPTIVDSYTSYPTGPSTETYTFTGLTANTLYQITISIIQGGVTFNTCTALRITAPLNCNSPSNVSSTTDQIL